MKKIILIFLLLIYQLSLTLIICAPNRYIQYNSEDRKYDFFFNDQLYYSYSIISNKGSLGALDVFDNLTSRFKPSNSGGPRIDFNGTIKHIYEIPPENVTLLSSQLLDSKTLLIKWKVTYGSLYYQYNYKIIFADRNHLIIEVNEESKSPNVYVISFELDRCEYASSKPRIIRVPYLTLFNILLCNNKFVSLYADWEKTNASELKPFNPSSYYDVPNPNTSARFSHYINYHKKTDNTRNPLKEIIHLKVSDNLYEVLPDISGGTAPKKDEIAKKIVLSFGAPFLWLLEPEAGGYPYKVLDSINNALDNIPISGTTYDFQDLYVIIKNYQYHGFDIALPEVLGENNEPAKTDIWFATGGGCTQQGGNHTAGKDKLKLLRNHTVDTLKFGFAFHQQYVDYYPSATVYDSNNVALNSDFTPKSGWQESKNCGINGGKGARILSPSKTLSIAGYWTSRLQEYSPTWAYVDVHTAINPSDVVDYKSSTDSAGYFKYALNTYRALANNLRTIIQGPIQGEGNNHFLYAGYYDDFEARLYTADPNIYGYKAPLLLDFDILKIRPKSALHGVGHYQNFFAPTYSGEYAPPNGLNTIHQLIYIASEIAYGHSPLITKANVNDHLINQTRLEYQHTYQIQKYIYNQTPYPQNIMYYDDGTRSFYTSSDYIRNHKENWDDTLSLYFMSKVKVIYPNGVTVYVNRHPYSPWTIPDNYTNGRFFYCTGIDEQGISNSLSSYLKILPPKFGWLVYIPSYLLGKININNIEQSENFELYNNYPNPFNPITTIKYYVPQKSFVTIKVYNILGQEISTLVNEVKDRGKHEIEFDASNLSSGVYFYTLYSGNNFLSKKMILIK